jgi:hypothetical protein
MDTKLEIKTDTHVCRTYGASFTVHCLARPVLQHLVLTGSGLTEVEPDVADIKLANAIHAEPIFRARWDRLEQEYDCDTEAGLQRYLCYQSSRQVGNALRRLGFTKEDTAQVLKATK